MRAVRDNTARVDALREAMRLDENGLAMILADAPLVAKDIEKVIGETSPDRETTERNQKAASVTWAAAGTISV